MLHTQALLLQINAALLRLNNGLSLNRGTSLTARCTITKQRALSWTGRNSLFFSFRTFSTSTFSATWITLKCNAYTSVRGLLNSCTHSGKQDTKGNTTKEISIAFNQQQKPRHSYLRDVIGHQGRTREIGKGNVTQTYLPSGHKAQ